MNEAMDMVNEATLIKNAQQGDAQALEELWNRFTPKLFGYLINLTKNRQLAEDLLQNTWLKAIAALPNYQARGVGLGGWLFTIAKNECRQHWRQPASTKEVPLDESIHDQSTHMKNNLETKLFVEKILADLSDDDQEILRLRYIADLPIADIAQVLNLNFVTVRVRVHRAITRARTVLKSQTL
jgi:RNA polymerase sigma-70 factor (ECF subfamily)